MNMEINICILDTSFFFVSSYICIRDSYPGIFNNLISNDQTFLPSPDGRPPRGFMRNYAMELATLTDDMRGFHEEAMQQQHIAIIIMYLFILFSFAYNTFFADGHKLCTDDIDTRFSVS